MPTIRILDETADVDLLRTAWCFAADAPEWFRQADSICRETLEDFLRTAKDELIVGIFEDDLAAVVRFVPGGRGVYELHLMVRKGADAKTVSEACRSIKAYLADREITKLAGWVPRVNRGVIRLYRDLGFHHREIKCYQGKVKNRACEWLYFESEKIVANFAE